MVNYNGLTVHKDGVVMSVVFIKTVIYVNTQPRSRTLLILGDDNFTILQVDIGIHLTTAQKFRVDRFSGNPTFFSSPEPKAQR